MTAQSSTPTLTMMRGLPASGKSTWAKKRILHNTPGTIIRVSKDMLRAMLHENVHAKGTEKQVLAARDAIIASSLSARVSVIVDDTNLAPFHEKNLRTLATRHRARFLVQDFTSVPLDECIRRNVFRADSVPEKVIREMYEKYVATDAAPNSPVQEMSPVRRPAVIVDIDGTLALRGDRSPFEWNKVASDLPNMPVVATVQALAAKGFAIVYCSGRDSVCFEQTRTWIDAHVQVSGPLFMRAAGDTRKDAIVKRELYEMFIAAAFDVQFVLDDRDQVVDLWRNELNIPCFQVAPGSF